MSRLSRYKPVKKKNRQRSARKFVEAFGEGGERGEYVRAKGCVVWARWKNTEHPCEGRIHAHHVRSRAAGGDADTLVGLCERHHRAVHNLGRTTFSKRTDVDLELAAAVLRRAWSDDYI